MRPTMRGHAAALAALLVLAVGAGAAEPPPAADDAAEANLARAESLLRGGAAAAAIAELEATLPLLAHGGNGRARALHMLSAGYGQTAAWAAAERAARGALEAGGLSRAASGDVELRLAEALMRQGRARDALIPLQRGMHGSGEPSHATHQLAALIYTEAGRCELALPELKAVIAAGTALDPAWLVRLRQCEAESNRRGAASAMVTEALLRNPGDKRYWKQGVATYRDAKQPAGALALLELQSRQGMLDANETMDLARAYLDNGMPQRAARLIERALDSALLPRSRAALELLGAAWRQAREPAAALAAYRAIIALRPDGNIYLAIGELELEAGHPHEAAEALQNALRQSVLRDAARANLLLGMAAVQSGDGATATRALTTASKAAQTREAAQWWLGEAASLPGAGGKVESVATSRAAHPSPTVTSDKDRG